MNNFTFGPCVVAAVASALRRKGLNSVCDCHLYVTNPQASVEVCARHLPHSLTRKESCLLTSVEQSQDMPTVSGSASERVHHRWEVLGEWQRDAASVWPCSVRIAGLTRHPQLRRHCFGSKQ